VEISATEQAISDFDWFAIDQDDNIAHFASAGGRLPRSVAISAEDNTFVTTYFQSLTAADNAFVINPAFRLPNDIKTPEQRARFFRTYVFYAACGLYSFDRTEVYVRGASTNFDYELIASPRDQRKFADLPEYIQKILVRTKYTGYFTTDRTLNLSAIA
jgi:hypothetical protein